MKVVALLLILAVCSYAQRYRYGQQPKLKKRFRPNRKVKPTFHQEEIKVQKKPTFLKTLNVLTFGAGSAFLTLYGGARQSLVYGTVGFMFGEVMAWEFTDSFSDGGKEKAVFFTGLISAITHALLSQDVSMLSTAIMLGNFVPTLAVSYIEKEELNADGFFWVLMVSCCCFIIATRFLGQQKRSYMMGIFGACGFVFTLEYFTKNGWFDDAMFSADSLTGKQDPNYKVLVQILLLSLLSIWAQKDLMKKVPKLFDMHK